jgi:hypothetical protein
MLALKSFVDLIVDKKTTSVQYLLTLTATTLSSVQFVMLELKLKALTTLIIAGKVI